MTDTQRIWLVCIAVQLGVLAAFCIVGTIVYDLIAAKHGWRTVSGETLGLGRKYAAVALFVTGFLAFALGMLMGHLFIPQYIEVAP